MATALINTAFDHMDAGRMELAKVAFEKAVTSFPDSIETRVNYAACLSECGEGQRALTELDAVLEKHPSSFEARGNAAMIAMELNDNASAVRHFTAAVALPSGEDWFDGHYNLANLLAERGAGFESQAISHYEAAIKLDPSAGEAHTNFAACLRTAGRLLDAISHLHTATQAKPAHAPAWYNLAICEYNTGEMELALEHASEARRRWAGNPATSGKVYIEVEVLLAQLYANSDDPGRALAHLSRAVEAGTGPEREAHSMQLYSRLVSMRRDEDARAVAVAAANRATTSLGKSFFLVLAGDLSGAQDALSSGDEALGGEGAVDPTCLAGIMSLSIPGAKHLAHKALLFKALVDAGAAEVAPETFLVQTDAELTKAMEGHPAAGNSWFLKNPAMQRGQGVFVIRTPEEARGKLAKGQRDPWVLQPAVDPQALIQGRKFGLRVHALVALRQGHPPALYVFRETVLTLCGAAYDPSSNDALVQITCTSVQRHLEGYERAKVKGCGSVMYEEGYAKAWPKIQRAVARSIGAVWGEGGKWGEEAGKALSWQLFGYDFLMGADGEPSLVEANIAPQLGDPQAMADLREKLALPMINSLPRLVLHIAGGEIEQKAIGGEHEWSKWDRVPVPGVAAAP